MVSGKQNVAIAYARKHKYDWVLVVVPLALAKRGNEQATMNYWFDSFIELPGEAPNEWRNVFTGETIQTEKRIALEELFRLFPVGLLFGGRL
jgi:(1->4)-alpha-D-glucan 1-alpha-D-glucosylmutase